ALSTPASAQVEVTVGGYMQQWFGWGDNDAAAGNLQDVNTFTEGEIIFSFQGVTDNGLTFGGQVQLEDNANSTSGTTDIIDESYLFVSGDFGRVLLGSENSAAYLMHITPPAVGMGLNSGSQNRFIANGTGSSPFRTPFGATTIEAAGDNDSEKITYFTPRFNGVQLGISYAPELIQDDVVQQSRVGQYVNGISIGANYVGEFDGVEVSLSGGFVYAEQGAGFTTVANVAGVDTTDDFYGANAGISIAYMGFEAGFSYANVWSGRISGAGATLASTEGQAFHGGIAYTTGPLSLGLGALYGTSEGLLNDSDNDEHLNVQGGVQYELGQGISVAGIVGWNEFDDEGTTADNEGVYVAGGVLVSF
ncbi:MAG: porin, partial [Candidatus Accumulibacter sp.]|nr:porin [Accumulibacter sp.]